MCAHKEDVYALMLAYLPLPLFIGIFACIPVIYLLPCESCKTARQPKQAKQDRLTRQARQARVLNKTVQHGEQSRIKTLKP